MVALACRDYGFECEYTADGESVQEVVEKFGKHTFEEHGIEYSAEVLMHFIERQKNLDRI